MTHTHSSQSLAAALLIGMTASTFGAGFQLAERSGAGLGRAFSGEAAIADDASIIASNPAGMSLLDDMSFAVGVSYINPDVNVNGTSPGNPNTLSDRDIAPTAFVPYSYLSKRINDKISVGVGTFTSFGLKSDYSSTFAASGPQTDYSEITTVTMNPSIAYEINDQFSVGAGFSIMYAKGEITSLLPGAGTNLFALEGDDIAFGYNLGFLYQFSDDTRIGLHYRSKMDLNIEGTASLGGPLSAVGALRSATLDVTLPDTIELSAYHRVNSKWALHGDIVWTGWSSFEELAPKVDARIDPILATPEDWEDAFRFSVGATYLHSETLTLRVGAAYDESPVPGANRRTLRIPDSDRIWVSAGATYKIDEHYNLDIGYAYLFGSDADIDDPTFQGTGGGNVNLLAVGVSGSF